MQFGVDQAALARNVAGYLWAGLRRGEGALVIAGAENQGAIARQLELLGADLADVLQSRHLVVWDAQATLKGFLVDGQPDWDRFQRLMWAAILQVRRRKLEVRAYGEMVSILWQQRRYAAALRLEQFWNKLLEQPFLSLFCAYAVDVFGNDCDFAGLDGVLATHTHVVPADLDGHLALALDCALDDLLGADAASVRLRMKAHDRPAWAIMPVAERIALWLRQNLPEQAGRILERARRHAELLAAAPLSGYRA